MVSIISCLRRNLVGGIWFFAIISSILVCKPAFCEELTLTQAEMDYAQAVEKRKSQNFVEAKSLFLSAAQNTFDSELAMKSLSRAVFCEIRLKNFTAADQLYEEIRNDYSTQKNFHGAIAYCANSYLSARKFEKTKQAYQLILDNTTDSNLIFYSLSTIAVCKIELGEFDSAESIANEVIANYSEHPRFVPAVVDFSRSYHNQKKFDKAKQCHQLLLGMNISSDQAFKSLRRVAEYELQAKNYVAAEQAINKLINNHSGNQLFQKAICTFADMYWNVTEYKKSKNFYKYVSQNSSDAEQAFNAQLKVMQAEMKLDNYAAALIAFDELWKNHSSAKAFVEKATRVCGSIIQFESPQTVLPYIDRALEVTNEAETAVKMLQFKAQCLIDTGQSQQAEAVRQEIELYSDKEYYPGVQLAIAYRYRKNGEYTKAMDIYKKILQSSTDQARRIDTLVGIAAVSASIGDDSGVTAIVKSLCRDFAGHEKLGWAVFVIGEEYQLNAHTADGKSQIQKNALHKKAINIWKKNIENISDQHNKCYGYYYTGLAYNFLKDYQKSLMHFHNVVNKFPDEKQAASALLMIGRIYQKDSHIKPVMVAPASDPNEMVSGPLSETADPNSTEILPAESLNPDAVTIKSAKAAFELLLEKYPNSSGAAYASQWLSRNSSK